MSVNIDIKDDSCWCCGDKKEGMTRHHAIPQTLCPKQNVLVPVCGDCHTKINTQDVSGMTALTYKLVSSVDELNRRANALVNNVENYMVKVKFKK